MILGKDRVTLWMADDNDRQGVKYTQDVGPGDVVSLKLYQMHEVVHLTEYTMKLGLFVAPTPTHMKQSSFKGRLWGGARPCESGHHCTCQQY